MSQRVTLKTIAEACSVSVATVSYALRKSSHIPQSTRERIQKVADEMGYRPDPALSSLASRKRRNGQTSFYASVAVLHPNPLESRATQLFNGHCQHFKEKMESFGCSVTDFQVDSSRYRPERLAQILRTRGIRGILLGWGSWPESIRSFPWNEFAVISTERTDLGEAIDKVSMNHFHALDDIFQRLDSYSDKRYGLILHDDCPSSTESLIIGSFQANLFERPHLDKSISVYKYHLGEGPERFMEWYRTHSPEVIISHRSIDPKFFQSAGIDLSGQPRVVVIEVDETSSVEYSGIYSEAELGRTIATMLARKIRNDEVKESPRSSKLTLVTGIWHEGQTLGS